MGALNRITTIHPRTYNEAKNIGESFRDGTPVIMNLSDMDDADAKRLVDFAAGLVFGLHGQIERVTSKVFLLSPAHVEVSAEEGAGGAHRPAACSTRADPHTARPGPAAPWQGEPMICWVHNIVATSFASSVFLFFVVLSDGWSSTGCRRSPGTGGPAGALLVVAESIYTVTDPPLKALRRVIPPLKLGAPAARPGLPGPDAADHPPDEHPVVALPILRWSGRIL